MNAEILDDIYNIRNKGMPKTTATLTQNITPQSLPDLSANSLALGANTANAVAANNQNNAEIGKMCGNALEEKNAGVIPMK